MDPFPPTEQQQAVIAHRSGNLLVFAGPGTGKTETLARRFAALVAEGTQANRILVLTFSRRAADEMRDRVLLRLRQSQGTGLAVSELFVRTFHGFCGRLLDGGDLRGRRRELLTPVKERLLWRKVIHDMSGRLGSFDPSVTDSFRFATDCLNIIAHLKGQGVGAEDLAEQARGNARLADIAAIFAAMEAERVRLDLHDYRDLVNEAVGALRDPRSAAASWLHAAAFAHVLVDEFQDSDLMQLRLLEVMRDVMRPAPVFCFVGDVNQSIYRFRGASPSNVETAQQIFACEELPLRDNRRSAQAVLSVANADPTLDPKSLTAAADQALRGSVRLERPRSIDEEIKTIRDAVAARIAAGTAPRAIAVLLRQARPYQELVTESLREASVPVAALPAAGFHEDALVDGVLTALRLMADPENQRLWGRLLGNPIVGYRPLDVRYAFDEGRRAKMTDPRAMLRINPPGGWRPIGDFLKAWARCASAYASATPWQLVRSIVYELDLLRPVREGVALKGFDPTASPLRLDALLHAAEDYSEASGRVDHAGQSSQGVHEFVARLDETVSLLADATQPPASVTQGVRVMSIHAAKGLEFDFVVIPQLIDGVLPASARPNRLLPSRSMRALADRGISVSLSDSEAAKEEHSLWYVALTRAKFDVLATAALLDDEGVDMQLSPFARAILENAEPASTQTADSVLDLSPIQATLWDPETILSNGPPGPPLHAEGPGPIRLPIETLTPTGIKNFIDCPRRFFYGDLLKLPSRDDDLTQYGIVLHRILRRFHELESDFEHVVDVAAASAKYRETLHEIIAEETAVEDPAAGLGPLARFEREDLTLRLDRYAHRLAEEAAATPFSVLGCECVVHSSFNGVSVRGQVDRVDRLAQGGLVVRDYKSGRMYGTGLAAALRSMFARIDDGETVFGDAPDGLNLQTILYIPGVEAMFVERVCRLDYLYFRGFGAQNNGELIRDSTPIVSGGATDQRSLSLAEIARVEKDVAARIVALCSSGEMVRFPTAHDDKPCRICSFTRICPGPGARV